jgi:hypothetical protein
MMLTTGLNGLRVMISGGNSDPRTGGAAVVSGSLLPSLESSGFLLPSLESVRWGLEACLQSRKLAIEQPRLGDDMVFTQPDPMTKQRDI